MDSPCSKACIGPFFQQYNIVKTFALSTFRPNCLGVMGEKEGWRLCMDINLTGVLHGTNLAME